MEQTFDTPQLVSCRFEPPRSRPLVLQLLPQPPDVLLLHRDVLGALFIFMQLLTQLPDFVLLLAQCFFCLCLGFLR